MDRGLARAALAGCALFLSLAAPAGAATTIVVTSTADSGGGSVRAALASADPGDTISIPTPGDYAVTSAELAVTKNVVIQGAGASQVRLVADGNNRVLNVSAGDVTISGLTVTGGGLTGSSVEGGGIANGTGRLALRNVTVSNNFANDPSASIPGGGGIVNHGGTLVLIESLVTGNTTSITAAGGGIPQGGGIHSQDGNVAITRSTITENTASIAMEGGVSDGGGISISRGRLDIVDSTIAANHALGGSVPRGGGAFVFNATTNITGSTITGNNAADNTIPEGGGFMQIEGSLQMVNSTVSGNSADNTDLSDSGGLLLGSLTAEITNSTIANNSATGTGGRGGNLNIFDSTLTFRNTIVGGGTAVTDANCSVASDATINSSGGNLDSLDQCRFTGPGDLRNTDPLLAPLANNGGPTFTHALMPGSPALNAGTNTGCPAVDQRGIARPQDLTCDIGAFEHVFATDLSVTKQPSRASVPVGRTVSYVISVSNAGPDPAADVLLTDLLPAGARLVSATGSAGSCDRGAATCTLGELAAGARTDVTIVLRPTDPGTLTNTVRVSGRRPDANAANDSASATVSVTPLALRNVRVRPRIFEEGDKLPRVFASARTGTTIRFRLSARARVKFSFARALGGGRFQRAGSFSRRVGAGAKRVRFQGRLSRRKSLVPGSYRMTVVARDSFGNRSKPKRVKLRILPPA